MELRVCPSSVSCLPRSPPLLSAAPVATVEDGARGFTVREHAHEAHTHAFSRDANFMPRIWASNAWGASLAVGNAWVSRLSPDWLSPAVCRTSVQTVTEWAPNYSFGSNPKRMSSSRQTGEELSCAQRRCTCRETGWLVFLTVRVCVCACVCWHGRTGYDLITTLVFLFASKLPTQLLSDDRKSDPPYFIYRCGFGINIKSLKKLYDKWKTSR